MPRRKRVTGQNERRRKVRRRENNDDDEEDDENTLVISDSESDEEDEDRAMTLTSRTARRLERDKKAHVQDMTEDEMLDLALRLSKQEANCASQREQVEDDDMRKAIAESLQVSCSQSSETSLKRTRSAAKPRQDRDAVAPAHARCKLSFPGPNEKGGALKRPEDDGPLPPMPDLSQRTPSPPSSTLPSVPSAASQESRSSRPAEEESNDEAPRSDSPLGRSPVFLRHCSVRVNPLNASEPSPDASPAPRSSLGFSESQNSPPPPPKSPVFPKTDSKRCTKLTRGKFRGCSPSHSSSSSTFTGGVCKPEDACRESSSHKRSVGGRALKSDVSPAADGSSLDDFTSHMVLHLSDEDDDGEENDEIVPPSPVFPQGRGSCAGQSSLSPTQPCPSPRDPKRAESLPPGASAGPGFPPASEGNGLGVVSYYWGVPFCPKGQSPDDYTRVILAQLEVYEKSLKEAQRKLLHKADWGVPVFPRPLEKPRGRRLKRHRAPRLLEEEEEEDEDQEEGKREGEEPNQEEKERKGQAERTEREASQPRSEKGAENEQRETYVVVSSPETQELSGKSPSRFERESTTTAKGSRRKPLSRDLSEETRIHPEPDEGGEEDRSGRPDAESAACPETQMTDDNTPELMVTSPAQLQADADVMEVDEASEPAPEADEGMEQERPGEEQPQGHSVSSQVECPMCTRLFPLSKVEMHAAYCNGSVEEQEQEQHQEQQENLSQGNARRRSVRRTAPEDDVRFDKSAQQEKCYVCNKFFTRTEYSHHVDQCLQQIRTRGTKQENGLLPALNRTETVHLDDGEAGPSNATVRNHRNLTHSSATADGSAASPGYYVSSSPIKSFAPISELKDCLIDFRQQFPDRTGSRLGRKRKFKR